MTKTLLLSLLLLPGLAGAVTIADWPLPAPRDAAQPNLSRAPDGSLLLSWIERRGEAGHRLVFARQDAGQPDWSKPRVIAAGDDFFVNWADFPALQALPDGSLWAHTLVKSGEATYAYDVVLHVSTDGGRRWRPTAPVHDDGTLTEHGFVTLWPQPSGGLGIAWLDGRFTAGGQGHADHDGHAGHADAGAMTLRAAGFGLPGRRTSDVQLDGMTCDCCQTDSAVADGGVLVVYRGRDPGEVRDIKIVRNDGSGWTAPATVHADGWVTAGCPVNGPAIAARGQAAWVAWYTGVAEMPSIRIARSGDGGASFGPMREVARGEAQHGRVDLAADDTGVWLAWLEEAAGVQTLWLARLAPDLSAEHFRVKVATVAGRGRATGFPRIQLGDGAAWLAWTEVVAGRPRLRGASVRP